MVKSARVGDLRCSNIIQFCVCVQLNKKTLFKSSDFSYSSIIIEIRNHEENNFLVELK